MKKLVGNCIDRAHDSQIKAIYLLLTCTPSHKSLHILLHTHQTWPG